MKSVFVFHIFILFATCGFHCPGNASRILGVFPAPSHSHQIVFHHLLEELSERGHNITAITPNPTKSKNYNEIDVSHVYEYWNKKFDFAADSNAVLRWLPEAFMLVMIGALRDICNIYLSDPKVKHLISSQESFDVLIVEWGVAPCVYPFYLQTNKTMIGIRSLSLGSYTHQAVGSTSNPAYVPELFFPYSDHMSFSQRLRNMLFEVLSYTWVKYMLTDQWYTAVNYFGWDLPSLHEIEADVSVILENTHFSVFYPKPVAANVVHIGGPPFHLNKRNVVSALPKDLKEFLDNAPDGVIYFSLGSNVKSSTMPESKRKLFLDAFRQIKQKVLWKWETDDLPDKPDNVKVQKWLPQTDVLAHPNVKVFMTQCGLQSMGEATHFNVPMVAIPFFADQEMNAKKLTSVGVAIRLDFETMTTEEILAAINDVANNPKYKEAMLKYSALTKDQPQNPMDRAVWWVEYVLRHNGARHLRSAAVDMPWYQYFLLDVLAVLFLGILIVSYLIYFVISRLWRLLVKSKVKSKKD